MYIQYLSATSGSLFRQGDNLLVFDGRTSRKVSTLSTSKKVLLQLEYNHARDEIISGGSDGCFVWRLEAVHCELYALGEAMLHCQPKSRRRDESWKVRC